ncbi:MAG: ImmA/IrrE family metallo-endopeptidase [Verrucomicrobia bacterium]|nr:ImmA/IrrE family metallo-endopeptidase [Verrucomicrobiota bacterium]
MKAHASKISRFWTHPSIRALPGNDPIHDIRSRANAVTLEAMQAGWSGPPFDPAKLAEHMGFRVVPSEDVTDARIVPLPDRRCQIEFNPCKPKARIRFSIAHELAHTLFPDCYESVRHRLLASEREGDDWQLEMLCNLGAAEFLMPVGAFQELKSGDVGIDRLLELRKQFEVSIEAVLLRVVKLTQNSCAVFAASRKEQGRHPDKFVLDYIIGSRTWPLTTTSGCLLPQDTHVGECAAIGYTAKGDETWDAGFGPVHLEAVGIPPFPGARFPRVVGIVHSSPERAGEARGIQFLVGDATEPRGSDLRIIAHVVNDKTPNWGAGFGLAVRKKWPHVQNAFRDWVMTTHRALSLGNVYHTKLDEQTIVLQMVCQHGYGPSPTPRIRYAALKACLEQIAEFALDHHASIHMPRIGAGQGGGAWTLIENLIDEVLCARGLSVTVYDLPSQQLAVRKLQPSLFDLSAK